MDYFFNLSKDHLKEASEIIGYIGVISGFLFAVWKKLIKPRIELKKEEKRRDEELLTKINKIYEEVTPNGGGSIKDAIKRLEAKSAIIEEKINLMKSVQNAFREDGDAGIFQCDQEGRNFYVNRTYAKWLGVSKTDLMGFGWKNYLSSFSERDDYDLEWKEGFKEGREVKFPIAYKNHLGERVFCDVHAYPILDSDKNVVNYLGVMYRETPKRTY